MKKELQIKEQKIIMNMHNELNVIKSDLKHVKDNIKKNNVKLQIINQIPDKLLKSPYSKSKDNHYIKYQDKSLPTHLLFNN
jgi:uncharacterized protein YcgL (UPF0745 family)